MQFYPTLVTFHILFAGIWLLNLFVNSLFKKLISNNKHRSGEKKFIKLYLSMTNQLGMIGAVGILLTGIFMTMMNPGYGFFQMSANHWLVSKQIIMVILLAIIFLFVIPQSKKIKASLGEDLESNSPISEEGYANLNKMYRLGLIINILVVINFLFAVTHRFMG